MPVLAQMNVARARAPMDDPVFDEFNRALEPVNAAADRAPGFVWRLDGVDASPAMVEHEADGWLVNLSAWRSLEDLLAFVRSPEHLAVMRERARWFERIETNLVLWWMDDKSMPTFEEGMERIRHLEANGPSRSAFNFSRPYAAKE